MSFDVCGPLPRGVTVLEASAGTGKTYTIAALAARYVAEGTPLERLLLVTFTRMATGELRERVRERLVAVERGLSGEGSEDPVVALLAADSPDQVALRRARLRRALADFDAATIATTHGFCQEALAGLGVAGDLEPEFRVVEEIDDLLDEVVDDLYVRRFSTSGEAPPFGLAQARAVARVAVANPAAPIVEATSEVGAMRRRLALAVRAELEVRKRRLGVLTFDDLLTRLAAALGGEGGAGVAARLGARFEVVLVDEFQDTDPVQWEIFRRTFGSARALVLVGDPKQAIYAFRGADVHAYLAAEGDADTRATLDLNWRSDERLIGAYDALFGAGTQLGHAGIVYRRVRAVAAGSRLVGAGVALRVRVVMREDGAVRLTQQGFASNAAAREHVARDLAADLVRLFSCGAAVADAGPVRPGHVAVLVPTNRNGALVREALAEVGVPAVISGAGSVLATEPARDWLRLLAALERPAVVGRARAAALTCFFGWPAARVAEAGELEWEDVHRRLHDWARILRAHGVAALLETIVLDEGLPARLLAFVDGERRLTDLRHIGQLLHVAASGEPLGTTALVAWLRRRIAEAQAGEDAADEERSRRLDSDAEAVQVMTIHRSKGLEFPIVYAPFLWEARYIPRDPEPVCFHDAAAGARRTLDVSLSGAAFGRHRAQSLVEQRGEDLRLAYVALTRARHQAVLWWVGSFDSRNSPLGRLLFSRSPDDGVVAAFGDATPGDAAAVSRFAQVAAAAPAECVAVERARVGGLPVAWSPPLAAPAGLSVAVFARRLDADWRRTSYSDITAAAHEARVASEPEEEGVADEEQPGVSAPVGLGELPLASMPTGAAVGTVVHRVLEATDFAAADLEAELRSAVGAGGGLLGDRLDLVVAGLAGAISAPLGPVAGGWRLRDLGRADRLDELGFELPLAGGDRPRGRVGLADIAGLLRAHLGGEDPLAGYAERLADGALRQDVRGYLTGSLDLVVRAPGGRFFVVDYKTNWLGRGSLTAWDYRPEALAAEMQRAHYGLQALLYVVALHRYLRWRVPGYRCSERLGGVLYLFVRGMTGASVDGRPCGVFGWLPPAELVEALSTALDGGGS